MRYWPVSLSLPDDVALRESPLFCGCGAVSISSGQRELLRAWVLALASEFDHPFHLRQGHASAFRLQDEINVVVFVGAENAVPGVSSSRFRQQSDPFPVPQRL
jgi:hypothetical protein